MSWLWELLWHHETTPAWPLDEKTAVSADMVSMSMLFIYLMQLYVENPVVAFGCILRIFGSSSYAQIYKHICACICLDI